VNKYEFTLILKGQLELTEEMADELVEAGCAMEHRGSATASFQLIFTERRIP
jgi:hypothetical protein